MGKEELLDVFKKENLSLRYGGKNIFIVDDPKNDRINTAKAFAKKYNGMFEIGGKKSGTTPTVYLNGYEIRFKNLKHRYGNAGHEFEEFILGEFRKVIKGDENIVNENVKLFLDIAKIDLVDIIDVEKNKQERREVEWIFSEDQLLTTDVTKTPERVADIIVTAKDSETGEIKKFYISNKTEKRKTIISAGIKGGVKNDKNIFKAICDWFDLDFNDVMNSFSLYKAEKEEKVEVSKIPLIMSKTKEKAMEKVLFYTFGYGYVYMSPTRTFMMDKRMLETLIRNPRNFYVKFPNESRKRLDILFETDKLSITINFRNKYGKVLPTHMLIDYDFK